MAYKKILVCLDGLALAETALPHAQTLASDDAEILLLRVPAKPAVEFSFPDPNIADNLIQEMEAETLAYLQPARGRLQKAAFRTSFLSPCRNDPAYDRRMPGKCDRHVHPRRSGVSAGYEEALQTGS